jgi:hypothetical protein
MVYQLDLRKCIYQLVGQWKNYEINQLFKYKNISKTTIYQTIKAVKMIYYEVVVKSKIATPRVADKQKVRNVLQGIKNRVIASSRLVARKQHQETQFFEF